ncbi:Crp/Fnr family transcriptional regulator [Candidimonas sp. SYP-B2681]|uniref:Crp/Fnr family transcriptional regulator n=1 Tax=Candidimonas sp. SYP-B2681 TaxID=2497686 RepID=UPI000F87BBF7|nr:Crp/Fnr family transcriptional regulator [Candidimonas sp. SYP-B2681]RTZ45519.1 Crp/Fnr family transcriptional regulator [Candidimonas sp. SYP-B2681]
MAEKAEFHLGSSNHSFLSPEFEKALRTHARLLRVPKKSTLFTYGSKSDGLYCLERGILRLSVTASNGREAVLSVLSPGRWFGEASLLGEEPHVHDARAVVDCEVIVVPAAAVHQVLENRPDFLLELARLVCRRYKQSLQRIDATILLPLPVRLAKRLLEVCKAQHPHYAGTGTPVLRLSQEDLSQMLGVSRQSINKLLKDWEGRSIVGVKYGQITLLDHDALQNLT